jgi:hypothetical protein
MSFLKQSINVLLGFVLVRSQCDAAFLASNSTTIIATKPTPTQLANSTQSSPPSSSGLDDALAAALASAYAGVGNDGSGGIGGGLRDGPIMLPNMAASPAAFGFAGARPMPMPMPWADPRASTHGSNFKFLSQLKES